MDTDFEPDIVDLQSWLCTTDIPDARAVWECSKYLSAPRALWLSTWKAAGRPDISEPAPYSTTSASA